MVDTVAGNVSTTASLAVGGSVGGVVDTNGDHDWYRVSLVAGQIYQFRTNPTGTASDFDTTLTIRNAAGTQLAFNDDGDNGTFSAVRFTAATSGTYFVDVGAYDDLETGAFNLTMTTAAALPVFSNDQIAYQLTNGYWGGASHRFNVAAGGTLSYDVSALTASGQTLAREAMRLWQDVTGVVFAEVTGGGRIIFDDSEAGAYASVAYSAGITSSARINISTQWLADYGTTLNSYSFQAYVHEVGHALGLGHAGNYNDEAEYPDSALFANDNWGATIMSYFSQTENDYSAAQGFTRQYVVTPTAADGIAMATLYGGQATTRTGDTQYGFANTSGRQVYDAVANPRVGYTIFDGGGRDTLDYSGFAMAQRIDLTPESYSNVGGQVGNVSIARGTIIENAVGGSGADVLQGNAVANNLRGGGGNDTLIGLRGDDVYVADSANTTVIETAGEGYDTVVVSAAAGAASFTLTAAADVELLQAAAGTAAINITGNAIAQRIEGNGGANILNGGGGADTLVGFAGDDSYLVRELGSVVVEGNGGGRDTVFTTVSYNLGVNEVEVLSTVSNADTVAIDLIGNFATQLVIGNYGANVLNGGSGGADTLIGLRGNDVYAVGSQSIGIVEAAGEGDDTLVSSASYQIRNGASIEVFAAQNRGGSEALVLTGNEVAQTVLGNAGANTLDGRGGADTLVGDGGADVFAFTTALGGGNIDTILDFAGDVIGLASDIFAAVTAGGITASEFTVGTAAGDADDRLIHDQASGRLFYDADGSGVGAAVQFAQLGTGLALSAASFVVIAPVADWGSA